MEEQEAIEAFDKFLKRKGFTGKIVIERTYATVGGGRMIVSANPKGVFPVSKDGYVDDPNHVFGEDV